MKYPLNDLLGRFVDNEVDGTQFRDTLEEWNRAGLSAQLSDAEAKLVANYFFEYFDRYAGETLPKFSSWERVKRDMRGEGNIDLQALRTGSAELLKALKREQQKRPPS